MLETERRETPEEARVRAGFSLAQAAKKLRVSQSYLRGFELHGKPPYTLARRLAALYRCKLDIFLYAPKRERSTTPTAVSRTKKQSD